MNKFAKKKSEPGFILEFKKTPVDMTRFEKWLNKEARNYKAGAERNQKVPDHIKVLFHLVENPEVSAVSASGIKYVLHEKYEGKEGLYKVLETKPFFIDKKKGIKHDKKFLVVEARKVLSMKEKLDNLLKLTPS